jgi:hypothetical protein
MPGEHRNMRTARPTENGGSILGGAFGGVAILALVGGRYNLHGYPLWLYGAVGAATGLAFWFGTGTESVRGEKLRGCLSAASRVNRAR